MAATMVVSRGRASSFDLTRVAPTRHKQQPQQQQQRQACDNGGPMAVARTPSERVPASVHATPPRDRQRAVSVGDASLSLGPQQVVLPSGNVTVTEQQKPPGSSTPATKRDDKIKTLSDDIAEYFSKHKETEDQFNRKMQLRARIEQIAKRIEPECQVFVIGSSMTHFGSNCSDLDICVMVSEQDHIDQWTEAMPFLYDLSRHFEAASVSRSQTMIPAKVPILRASGFEPTELYGDTTADINVNNAVAIKNTHMLHYYANWDERVRPLVLVVKEWARRQGINDASRGTLSSYSLTLMVLHYLQAGCRPAVLPCLQQLYPNKFHWTIDPLTLDTQEPLPRREEWERLPRNTESLGELFIGFLHYYAYEFNYDHHAVTVRFNMPMDRHRVVYCRSPYNRPSQWHCLCIEEPFTKSNTAHSVYDQMLFDEVKQVFRASYKSLQRGEPLDAVLASGFCARFAAEQAGGAGQGHLFHAHHFHHRQPAFHHHYHNNGRYPMMQPAAGGARWVEAALKNQTAAAIRARHSINTHLPPTAIYVQPALPPAAQMIVSDPGDFTPNKRHNGQPPVWPVARWHPSGAPAPGYYQPQWMRVQQQQQYGTWPSKGYNGRSSWNRRNGHVPMSNARVDPPAYVSDVIVEQRPASRRTSFSRRPDAQPKPVDESTPTVATDTGAPQLPVAVADQQKEELPQPDATAVKETESLRPATVLQAAAPSTSSPALTGQRIAVRDLLGEDWQRQAADKPTAAGGGIDGAARKSASAEATSARVDRKKPLLDTPAQPASQHVIQPILVLAAPIEALMRSCADRQESQQQHKPASQQHQQQPTAAGRTHSPLPEEPTPPKYAAVTAAGTKKS